MAGHPAVRAAGTTRVALAVLVTLAAPVAACGGSTIPAERRSAGETATEETRPALSPSLPEVTPEPTGTASPGGTGPATNIVEPDPDAVDLRPVPWTSVEPAEADSRVLLVDFDTRGEPCEVLGAVDVDQTVDEVTVTLLVGRQATADCPRDEEGNESASVTTLVVLTRPLGGRTVRDGATD